MRSDTDADTGTGTDTDTGTAGTDDVETDADAGTGGAPVDVHTRLAHSALGRWVVAAVLVVVGSWIVLPNMPAGPMRSEVEGWWRPATELGLVQDWAVFSPNPRSQSLDVRAEVELDSGELVVWDVPDFDPLVGAFRSYRWRKWQERVRLDARNDLWGPTVAWIRGEYPTAVRITLVRRWIDHDPLTAAGANDSPPDGWNEFRFCTWTDDSFASAGGGDRPAPAPECPT